MFVLEVLSGLQLSRANFHWTVILKLLPRRACEKTNNWSVSNHACVGKQGHWYVLPMYSCMHFWTQSPDRYEVPQVLACDTGNRCYSVPPPPPAAQFRNPFHFKDHFPLEGWYPVTVRTPSLAVGFSPGCCSSFLFLVFPHKVQTLASIAHRATSPATKEEFKNCYSVQIALCYVGWASEELKKSQEECLDNWGSQVFVFGTRKLLGRMGHVFSVTNRLPLTYITRSTNTKNTAALAQQAALPSLPTNGSTVQTKLNI